MLLLVAGRLAGVPALRRGAQAPPRRAGEVSEASAPLDRGIREYKAGAFESAERDLKEALRTNPHVAAAHAYLGLSMARTGDLTHATKELERASEIDPARSDYAYDEAVLLIKVKRYSAAIPILEKLRPESPQSPEVLVNLARAYAGSGEWNELSKLTAQLPDDLYGNAKFLEALAGILASSRRFDALEQLWEGAIRSEPGSSLPYAALAELWVEENRPREALALLDGAPAAARDPVFLYAYGESQMALGDSGATVTFRRLIEQTPGNQGAWAALARAEMRAGQFADAEATAQRAARRFPGSREFLYQLAVANYLMDRNGSALAAIRPVVAAPGYRNPQAILLAAVLESETGHYREAVTYFETLKHSETGCNALATYFYGSTLLRMRQPSRAVSELRAAIRCRPRFALAEYRLGQGLAELGRTRDALGELQKSIRDDAKLSDAYYALAQLRRRMGDARGARDALAQFNQLRHDAGPPDARLLRSTFEGQESQPGADRR